jgi:hypothetical protein
MLPIGYSGGKKIFIKNSHADCIPMRFASELQGRKQQGETRTHRFVAQLCSTLL